MKIEYTVRNFILYEPIESNGVEKDGDIYLCETDATPSNPAPENNIYIQYRGDAQCTLFFGDRPLEQTEQIENNSAKNTIPAGKYLFVQGILFPEDEGFPVTKEVEDAAEQLWLDFLWKEKKPASNTIYLRVLKEEHGHVFQLMRAVEDELES